jgi:hypothetical protein
MLFHLPSKKYFKAITPPMFIKLFLYKEKYLEFLFVIPFPIFGFWNAMVPFNCIKSMLPPLPYFKVNICERERERVREREREREGGGGSLNRVSQYPACYILVNCLMLLCWKWGNCIEVFVEWMDFEKINVLGIIILLCFLINRRLLQR